jgi:hypothetical protein
MHPLSLAQLVEQWTVNPFVAGSSPAGETFMLAYACYAYACYAYAFIAQLVRASPL